MADDVPAQLGFDGRLDVQEELGTTAEVEAAAGFAGRIGGVVEVQPDEVDACAEGREGPPRPRLPVVSTGEEQLHLPEVILGAAVESGTGKREHAAGADARREVILTKPINRECIFELLVWKQDTGIEAVADHALVGRAHARLRADLAGRADKDEQRAGDPKGAARAKDTI